ESKVTESEDSVSEASATEKSEIEESDIEETLTGAVSVNMIASCLDGKINKDTSIMKAVTDKKNQVKITWKRPIKTAKFYKLERFNEDGSRELIYDENDKLAGRTAYVDKTAKDDADSTFIYIITAYDKNRIELSDQKYAAVGTSNILFSQTSKDTKSMQIYFTKQRGPVSYKLERSDTKNKNTEFQTIYNFEVSKLNGQEASYQVTSYNGQEAVLFTDQGDFTYGTNHFYRVKAYIDYANLESLYSSAIAVRATLPEPTLVKIGGGPHENEEICYKCGYFYFTPVKDQNSDVKAYEILRSTSKDTGYKKILTIRSNKLGNLTEVDGQNVYTVKYTNFPPKVTYYYKVRAVGAKNYKGALSKSLSATCEFAPVTGVSVSNISISKLKITWKSEDCAKKYNIYRTILGSDTSPMNGEQAGEFIKIATVASKKGSVTYKDSKKLVGGKYFTYKIHPVNGKAEGAASDIVAGRPWVEPPKTLKVKSPSLKEIDVTWTAANKANSYTIQRTVSTNLDGTPNFDKCIVFGPYNSKNKEFQERKVKDKTVNAGVEYYYRVIANAYIRTDKNEDGTKNPIYGDSAPSAFVKGVSKPKAPTEFKVATIITTGDNAWKKAITLSFKPTSESISHYQILRKDNYTNGNYKVIKTVSNTAKSCTDTSLKRGRIYYYCVRAVYKDAQDKEITGNNAYLTFAMPSSIKLNASSKEISVGETYKVYVEEFSPSETTYKACTFDNNNSSIITSTSSGTEDGKPYVIFKGLKKGTAKVTVFSKNYEDAGDDSDLKQTCTITVK
ncbi:MAG: fibronectin type III domain-containing protein, partial [Lachnospiraceae bacterium]|nr:fibronectin type III domain-containing protein [Lachnospiraceae bacterium]